MALTHVDAGHAESYFASPGLCFAEYHTHATRQDLVHPVYGSTAVQESPSIKPLRTLRCKGIAQLLALRGERKTDTRALVMLQHVLVYTC